jgi:hypothetical protein
MKAVGARLPRYDGVGHVTGRTAYVDDVRVPGALWTKALRSPHHFAAIRRLDTSKAEQHPGVHAIVTYKDVPKNVHGHLEGLGVPGDEPLRTDATHPINRMFADVPQDEPDIHAEPGFEDEVCAFNLFAYLSRSDVTWNPSVVSQCKASLYCPTTEEYILPIIHGNDRVEWFVQMSDQIIWDVQDRDTGAVRAKVTMKAGDVAAMPGDIRHQGYSPKRSMLLVWENASPELPELIRTGKTSVYPVDF